MASATAAARDGTLTVAEVATVADVSLRYVNQAVESRLLPDAIFISDGKRRFLPAAASCVAFDLRFSKLLTPEARRAVVAKLVVRHRAALVDTRDWRGWAKALAGVTVDIDLVTVDLADVFAKVAARLDELEQAKAHVVSDPGILSGTPVLAGTRIPVHDIMASVDAKIPLDDLKDAYDIGEREIGWAWIWAKANPMVGRPRGSIKPAPGAAMASKRVSRRSLV